MKKLRIICKKNKSAKNTYMTGRWAIQSEFRCGLTAKAAYHDQSDGFVDRFKEKKSALPLNNNN